MTDQPVEDQWTIKHDLWVRFKVQKELKVITFLRNSYIVKHILLFIVYYKQ